MSKAPRRPPELRGRIFRGSSAVSRGLLTRNDLRSSAWRALFRDVYADSQVSVTHRGRCGAVIRWLSPPGTAVAGRSAAALYGVGQVRPHEPVDVLVPVLRLPEQSTGRAPQQSPAVVSESPPPPDPKPKAAPARLPDSTPEAEPVRTPNAMPEAEPVRTPNTTPGAPPAQMPRVEPDPESVAAADGRPACVAPAAGQARLVTRRGPAAGLRVHHGDADPGDVRERAGLLVTSVPRTCWDVAAWLDVVEAVTIIDGLLARQLTDVPTLRDYALARAGRRGWRSLLRAVDLADAGAESPQESRTRVRLVLAGLPRPRTQWVVADGGRFVARLDLAWPEFRVAVEYDGLWHDDPEQFHRDRRRLNRLLGGDWIVLHVTGKRLREDFDGFLAEVRSALRSRSRTPRP